MAGPFYVDDGGDGTTESSWATADTSINALDAEYTFASGEIVYFGHDMQCQATNSASLTIVGPGSGVPVYFISATQGSDPVTYQASTTNQIDTTEGAYDITFDGSFALYGLSIAPGRYFLVGSDSNEGFYAENLNVKVPANGNIFANGVNTVFKNLHLDLSADGTTARSASVIWSSARVIEIIGLTFTNAGYRTGTVFHPNFSANARLMVSGADFSGFTNATACELCYGDPVGSELIISNSLTAATWTPAADFTSKGFLTITNTGPADAPTYLYYQTYEGKSVSTTAIYRTSGATIETEATAWLVTTTSVCGEGSPFVTPFIYSDVSSTGSKTFDVYITNDTADFTDAQVWLEVEYLGTADEANTTIVSDHRTITTTAANQTDDITSTWNGTGPSFTYKQKLSVTATVNETGMYRARVCVGLASIASSRYFYIDPKVTVS